MMPAPLPSIADQIRTLAASAAAAAAAARAIGAHGGKRAAARAAEGLDARRRAARVALHRTAALQAIADQTGDGISLKQLIAALLDKGLGKAVGHVVETTTKHHADALVAAGLVTRTAGRRCKGSPGLYSITPAGLAALAAQSSPAIESTSPITQTTTGDL